MTNVTIKSVPKNNLKSCFIVLKVEVSITNQIIVEK